MSNPSGTYYASANSLNVVDTGDFLQLRGAANIRVEVLELTVWQTSLTTLSMNALRIQRGTTGTAGGNAITERLWDSGGLAVSAVEAVSMPTGDVATLNLDVHRGWNVLQEFVWLATPEFPLILRGSAEKLGVSLLIDVDMTIGWSILWQEFLA